MDQKQPYDMCHVRPGSRSHQGRAFVHGSRPNCPPEKSAACEPKSVANSLTQTHNGFYTGRGSLGVDVSHSQPGRPLDNSHVATSPETSDGYYAYSGNELSQRSAIGDGPAGKACRESDHCTRAEGDILDPVQVGSEELYPVFTTPHGPDVYWRPPVLTVNQMPAPVGGALDSQYPEPSTTCVTCGRYFHSDRTSFYHTDQETISSTTNQIVQVAGNYSLLPTVEYVPRSQRLHTQDTRLIAPDNDRLGVPFLEQSKSSGSLRKSAAANTSDSPTTVYTNKDSANNGPTKKRKRKPRTNKPRKARKLSVEGKAHAKAIRNLPGGACEDCKRNKTKARDH